MNELLSDMKTVHWWLGVVVVGTSINILSAHIPKWLGAGSRALLMRWILRGERDKVRFEDDVAVVSQSDISRTEFLARLISAHFRSGILFITALACIAEALKAGQNTTGTLYAVMSIFLLIGTAFHQFKAQYSEAVISIAAKRFQDGDANAGP